MDPAPRADRRAPRRITLALAGLMLSLAGPAAAQDVLRDETLLATMPEGMSLQALPVTLANGDVVRGTHRVRWSPDGRTVAYIGTVDGSMHPVIGEQVLDDYHFIAGPTFSADGQHVVFRVGKRLNPRKESWWVLHDGEKGKKEDWLGSVAISPDGERLAYWTQPGAKVVDKGPDTGAYKPGSQVLVVLDRKKRTWKRAEGPKVTSADSLTAPLFSADGQTVLTSCNRDGQWRVLRWERGEKKPDFEGASYAIPRDLATRPDGTSWAAVHDRYETRDGRYERVGSDVVVDGEPLPDDHDSLATPVFAPDGASLAYKVQHGERFAVGLDGTEVTPRYEFVFTPVFSPDATRLAYVASRGAAPDLRFGLGAHAERSLRDRGGERFVVVEDTSRREPAEGPAWLEVRDLTFSPDGEHLAYAARSADGWQVVLDHAAGPVHDDVGRPRFGDGSNVVGYGSRDDRELWWRLWTAR